SLDPRTLAEVGASVLTLATRLGVVDAGQRIVTEMQETIDATAALVQGRPRRRIFFAEWIDPPFCAGHWLPELVERAGGYDVLGRPGMPSRSTTWDGVLGLEPDLVVLGPCGFGADEAAARAAGLELPCPAVAVDG